MILQASQLEFGYRRRPVLQAVDLTVHSGERVGLFAPSGTGKTTLCKLLAGYLRPRKGTVTLDGRPLSDYPGACPVQMIWQHPEQALDPRIRLRQSLTEAGPVDQRLLDALHIQPAWLDRFPRELSGGELQRFCIARALTPPVRFLLCDEISAMLDLVTQAQLWAFLCAEAQARDIGLVVVSHNSALLDHLCSRVETLHRPDFITHPDHARKF